MRYNEKNNDSYLVLKEAVLKIDSYRNSCFEIDKINRKLTINNFENFKKYANYLATNVSEEANKDHFFETLNLLNIESAKIDSISQKMSMAPNILDN